MATNSQSRIRVYEEGRETLLCTRPPSFAAAISLDESVILEKHVTPRAAEYRERESDAHLLFLSDSQPVSATLQMDGQKFNGRTRSGDIWILPRLMPHSSIFDSPHGGLVLSVSNTVLERHVGPMSRGGQVELAPHFNSTDDQLAHLMRSLLAAAQEGIRANKLVGDLLLNAICLRIAQRYATSPLNATLRRGGLSAAQLRRVLEYIGENLDKNISLSTLADAANMSLCHFATSFKKTTGSSPHRYVLTQRIQRAEQLLRETSLSVLEVALKLGFGHPSNFARAFRRIKGASPNTLRRGTPEAQIVERTDSDRKIR
jgi:AraC family transcriptional regulator